MHRIVFFLMLFAMVACSKKPKEIPEEMLSPEEMVNIQVAVHLAEGKITNRKIEKQEKEALFQAYLKEIYKQHETDSLTFKKSFDYYMLDLEIARNIHQQVKDSLENMRKGLMEKEKGKNKVPIETKK